MRHSMIYKNTSSFYYFEKNASSFYYFSKARRGFSNASYVDVFPWIWKDFKRAGYVTQWAEDMQSIGKHQFKYTFFSKKSILIFNCCF